MRFKNEKVRVSYFSFSMLFLLYLGFSFFFSLLVSGALILFWFPIVLHWFPIAISPFSWVGRIWREDQGFLVEEVLSLWI